MGASFRFRLAGHDKVPHIKLKIFHFSSLYLTQPLSLSACALFLLSPRSQPRQTKKRKSLN